MNLMQTGLVRWFYVRHHLQPKCESFCALKLCCVNGGNHKILFCMCRMWLYIKVPDSFEHTTVRHFNLLCKFAFKNGGSRAPQFHSSKNCKSAITLQSCSPHIVTLKHFHVCLSGFKHKHKKIVRHHNCTHDGLQINSSQIKRVFSPHPHQL